MCVAERSADLQEGARREVFFGRHPCAYTSCELAREFCADRPSLVGEPSSGRFLCARSGERTSHQRFDPAAAGRLRDEMPTILLAETGAADQHLPASGAETSSELATRAEVTR